MAKKRTGHVSKPADSDISGPIKPRFELARMSPAKWRELGLSRNAATAAAGLARSIVRNHRRKKKQAIKRPDPAMRKFLEQYSLATERERRTINEVIVFSDVMLAVAVNGCGPEGFGGLVPDFCFEECCNEHDRCYSRGGSEADRLKCDIDFLECMKGEGPDWLADIYYWGVRTFGESVFNYHDTEPPRPVDCSGTCTKTEYRITSLRDFHTVTRNGSVINMVSGDARARLRQKARSQSRTVVRRGCEDGCSCKTTRTGDWREIPTVLIVRLPDGATARCDATERRRTHDGDCTKG